MELEIWNLELNFVPMLIGINGRFLTKPYTGLGQYSMNLLQALLKAKTDHQFLVVSQVEVDLPLDSRLKLKIVPEINWPRAGLKKVWWEQIQLIKTFKKSKIDLAHFFYPTAPFQKLPFKNITTVHDTIPWELSAYQQNWRGQLYQSYVRHNLKNADHIITVSDVVKQKLHHLIAYPLNKITSIPNAAADIFYLSPDLKIQKELAGKYQLKNPFLLYVGGYDVRKNVPLLINIYQKYIAPNYAIDLLLVGQKSLDGKLYDSFNYVQKKAAHDTLTSSGKIKTTGFVSAETLRHLYQMSLAFINLSGEEGFNIPLIEAAASQSPLILSDIPVHREVVGHHGLYCDLKKPDLIAKTIATVIADENVSQKYKAESFILAQKYSWTKTAQSVLALYDKV